MVKNAVMSDLGNRPSSSFYGDASDLQLLTKVLHHACNSIPLLSAYAHAYWTVLLTVLAGYCTREASDKLTPYSQVVECVRSLHSSVSELDCKVLALYCLVSVKLYRVLYRSTLRVTVSVELATTNELSMCVVYTRVLARCTHLSLVK